MKRIKKIILLIILILLICFIGKIIKKEHETTYKIDKYNISESFYIKNKNHWYDLVINNKKNTYIISLNENANKKKKIIKEIKYYKKNNLECIVPIYKKNIPSNIYCNENNKSVATTYLYNEDNSDFKEILTKAKKYNLKMSKNKDTIKKYKNLSIYKNNIKDNYKFIIWDYKGIYILSNNSQHYQKILDYDLYDNLMSVVVDNYYVLFENTSVNGIKNIYYYDLKKDKLSKYELKEKISKDSYINGIVNGLIYVTDKKEKKQYTINIKKKKIEEVGNEELKYQKYTNQKLNLLSKSDFFMKEQYFSNEQLNIEKMDSKDIKQEYNYYYYLNGNKFYKALDTHKNNPILLFELNNIKEWSIIDRDILLISKDTVYLYNEETGLRKILETNELNYNYKNISKLWKKQ